VIEEIVGTYLGEKIRGDKIGKSKDTYYRWVQCPDCEYSRWAAPKGPLNQALNTIRRCRACALKIQAFNFTLQGSRPRRWEVV
jgi:hypothetical protein